MDKTAILREKLRKKPDLAMILWILLCFILSRAFIYLVYLRVAGEPGIASFTEHFSIWDDGWYERCVIEMSDGVFPGEPWPQGDAVWAFFPLYPFLMSVIWRIIGRSISVQLLALIVNSLLFMLSEFVSFKHIMLTRGSIRQAASYVAFMSFGIQSYFFSINYTESLFLLLLTLCFLFLEREEYLKMGLAGLLLSATRNIGVMFVFVILCFRIQAYLKKDRDGARSLKGFFIENLSQPRLVLGTFMIPLGMFAYMAFLEYRIGDGLAFVRVQSAWGEREFRGLIGIVQNIWAHIDSLMPDFMGVVAVGTLILIVLCIKRFKRVHELLIPVIYYLVSVPYTLTSLPRYLIGSYTVVLGFTDLHRGWSRTARILACITAFFFEYLLLKAWFTGVNAQF